MVDIENRVNLNPKNACILVVDDEKSNVRLLEQMLATVGYENVISTSDPLQTLPLYKAHQCDLVLLDINMPVLDGFGVMEQLRCEIKDDLLPVLVLTAQHSQDYRQRALDEGARDYVTKPFDANELLSRVRNILEVQMAHKYMRHQNIILEQKVQDRTREIHNTRLQVVRHLGRAAEYRDNETGLHIIRMSKIAMLIGKAAGMTDSQSNLLLNAAPMHDIGKIGIPDDILLKPGKLDAEEWAVMKTHAQIGADILSGDSSDLMVMAHEIALTHHEKWNGQGYPNGLKGEAIPLAGRVTALADVFDALTSERPYKKAWSMDSAIDLIVQESGQHFDPRLVDCFLGQLSEINQIREKYAEPAEALKDDFNPDGNEKNISCG
jgi:putative two-component system response regulator